MAGVDAYNRGHSKAIRPLAEVTSAFLRIRSGHDYGDGHGDFAMNERAEAIAAAKELVEPLILFGEVSSWVNYSIEERWVIRYIDGEAMGDTIASGAEGPGLGEVPPDHCGKAGGRGRNGHGGQRNRDRSPSSRRVGRGPRRPPGLRHRRPQ